jgi:epoxyqueuosine reductase QueG
MDHSQMTQKQSTANTSQAAEAFARSLGAELYGVASATDYAREFPDKPAPSTFVENAQSVIVVGLPFEPGTVATVLRPELAGLRARAADQVTSGRVQPAGAERFFLSE